MYLRLSLLSSALLALSLVGPGCDTSSTSSAEGGAQEGERFPTDPTVNEGSGGAASGGASGSGSANVPNVGGDVEGVSAKGALGDPCAEHAACETNNCLPATFASGNPGFPDGYCTQACGSECPAGSACVDLGGGASYCMGLCAGDAACRDGYICSDGGTCWPDCNTFACAPGQSCSADGHCITPIDSSVLPGDTTPGGTDAPGDTDSPGDTPDNTDPPGDTDSPGDTTTPGSDPDAGLVGTSCESASQCLGGAGAYCFEDPDFPDGYCSIIDCQATGCDAVSECFQIDEEGTTVCLATCESDAECRPGYECADPGACIPATASPDPGTDPGPGTGDGAPVGAACGSDGQCVGGANATCFDFPDGYCTIASCASVGCQGDSTCFNFQDGESYCLDNCTSNSECRSGYVCDVDSVCWPGCAYTGCASGLECQEDGTCAEKEPCTSDAECDNGLVCDAGVCTLDWDWQPTGTPANCPDSVLPPKECTGSLTYCGDLVPFNPRTTIDYDDYPINGETSSNQYRSWPRRDMALLVDYATSYTTCMSEGWPGNGGPLGLGDMSEEDGTIPGTSIGQPGHPANTHEDGYDMDIAYYQVNTADNKLRSVCDHVSGGSDQYHCTSEPYLLDVWRTATVLGAMLTSDRVRVIGLDGKVGPLVEQAMQTLCNGGYLPTKACSNMYKLAYEVTNDGLGWYYFHHHHFHISLTGIAGSSTNSTLFTKCLVPDCTPAVHDSGVLDPHKVPGHAHVLNPKAPLEKVRVLHLDWD